MTDFETALLTKVTDLVLATTNGSSWIQNLISTVSGVILGSVLTALSQRSGRLNTFVISYKKDYLKNISGLFQSVGIDDEPGYMKLDLVIDFHNTSSRNIGIRSTAIEIRNPKSGTIRVEIKDEDTARSGGYMVIRDPMETINVDPYSVQRRKIVGFIDQKEIQFVKGEHTISFVFTRGKRIRKIRLSEKRDS